MPQAVREFLIGRDLGLSKRIVLVTGVLTVTAFGTLAAPTLWERFVGPSGSVTMQYAAAAAFIISVLASVYYLSEAAEIDPWLPTGAVLVVLTGYGVAGVVDGPALLFLFGPSLLLGVLAALVAYANDGAVTALSIVLFPVFGYMVNAPYAPVVNGDILVRLQIALLFALLFTLSIGIAGFLIGALLRRIRSYSHGQYAEELTHPDNVRRSADTDRIERRSADMDRPE